MTKQLTAVIEREGNGCVSLCPEVDITSQGATVDEAKRNLQEALELFCEAADPTEIKRRLLTRTSTTSFSENSESIKRTKQKRGNP